MKKKIIILIITLSIVFIVLFLFLKMFNKNTASKQYDENNVGEIYYSPIDEEHVAEDENGIMYADNEVLVVAAEGVGFSEIEALAREYDAEIVGYIEQTGDYQFKLSSAKTEKALKAIVADIESIEYVESVTFNYIFNNDYDSVSDDVHYGSMWENDLDDPDDNSGLSWGVEAINAPEVWAYLNEHKSDIDPIRIGLIDSGFDESHDDLNFAGVFYDNDANGQNISLKNKTHGTHVAGIMAACGVNQSGINGVYPYSSDSSEFLYGVSNIGTSSIDENGSNITSSMSEKIDFAELILRNVKVINHSLNNRRDRVKQIVDQEDGWENALDELTVNAEIEASFLNRLLNQGYDFVIVSAAGNDPDNNGINEGWESKYNSFLNAIENDKKYENVYNRIIVVGSVNDEFNISATSFAGNRVDVFAPGVDIYSTIPSIDSNGSKLPVEQQYGRKSGTSMAAPHVSGVCANVWSVNNDLTGEQVKQIVCEYTIANVSPYTSPDGETKGIVDCNNAVRAAAAEKGLKDKANKNKGVVLTWVVEAYSDGAPADNDNTRLADVTVDAYYSGTSKLAYTTKSDKDGHVEIFVTDGKYDITASLAGYGSCTLENVEVRSQEVTYCKWIELEINAIIQGEEPEKVASSEKELSSDQNVDHQEDSIAGKKVVDVSLGSKHTLALTENGEVYAWGDNEEKQLGVDDEFMLYSTNPVKIMDNVRDIEAKWNGSYAITNNDELYVWGEYVFMESYSAENTPIKVLDNVESTNGFFILTNDGELYEMKSVPYKIDGDEFDPVAENVISYSSSNCYITADNVMHYVTGDIYGSYATREKNVEGTVSTPGDRCYMAISDGGYLHMWGDDYKGSIPWADGYDFEEEGALKAGVSYICTDGSWNYGCIDNDGNAFVWGWNYSGQLGNGLSGGGDGVFAKGYYSDDFVFYQSNVRSLDVGGVTAAVTNDNKLFMSGSVYKDEDPVTDVTEITDNVSMFCGNDSTGVFAVIKTDGSLYMWGNNENGQLGNGTKTDSNEMIKIN